MDPESGILFFYIIELNIQAMAEEEYGKVDYIYDYMRMGRIEGHKCNLTAGYEWFISTLVKEEISWATAEVKNKMEDALKKFNI